MPHAAVAHPAATVVLLHDGLAGCEVLLVRRSARLAFHGGAWVFPGGRIDAGDYSDGNRGDLTAAARRAAVREAWEEGRVSVAPETLVMFSRWVTPEGLPKRFDAWFFAAPASDETVCVDGGEIEAHRWMRPRDALAAQRAGTLDLPPPTFVTLCQLVGYPTTAETLAALALRPFESFVPSLHVVPGGTCTLYSGDVAYETAELNQPGPRHRLWMLDSGWRYERG